MRMVSQALLTICVSRSSAPLGEALLLGWLWQSATIVALCHNHPSNNASPSGADDRLTQIVKSACETMRIYFLDHLIITDGRYYSYREEGRVI